jgi:protein SCO1/2
MRGLTKLLILCTILISLLVLVAHAVQAGSSRWGEKFFPNITLTTQDGKTVKFYDDLIKGKIVAINLIYTRCKDACPLETARFRQVQKLLGDRVGKDIFLYSISIDPEHDTPEVLRDYAEMYNAGPGWLFLTGKKEDIDLLSKKLGLYSEPDPKDRDGHIPAVLIGNEPAGQWVRNSATDNPHFLATQIGDFIDNWRNSEPAQQHSDVETVVDAAKDTKFDQGRYLFAARCAACHTIGHGDKIGPDLAGVTTTRERAWLARMVATPDKLLEEKDPIATALFHRYKQVRMPNLRLADSEVAALLAFLEQHAGTPSSGCRTGARNGVEEDMWAND